MDLTVAIALVPAKYQPYVPWALLVFVLACGAVTAFVKPPAPDSRWVPLWNIANKFAFNFAWAKSAFQPGLKPIMVDKDADRSIIKAKLGIPAEISTKP